MNEINDDEEDHTEDITIQEDMETAKTTTPRHQKLKESRHRSEEINGAVYIALALVLGIIIALLLFGLPAKAAPSSPSAPQTGEKLTLQVAIPCPGHAGIITDELKKINGVENVKFRLPNLFDVNYDPAKTSKQQILAIDIFNTYKATEV